MARIGLPCHPRGGLVYGLEHLGVLAFDPRHVSRFASSAAAARADCASALARSAAAATSFSLSATIRAAAASASSTVARFASASPLLPSPPRSSPAGLAAGLAAAAAALGTLLSGARLLSSPLRRRSDLFHLRPSEEAVTEGQDRPVNCISKST